MTTARRLTTALVVTAATAIAACGTDSGQETATATESTSATPSASTTETATENTDPAAPATFETITERELKLIAKNPGDHTDRAIIVYGRVLQTLTPSTGDVDISQLLCGASPDPNTWDTRIMIGTNSDRLKNIVEGDVVRAQIRSTGQTSSYTSALGKISNPAFWVFDISLLDS
ncbi:hypothetical protein [Nocardia sp. CC227C]|uniref:hypothetical protein n=1 Tax=Nocardia sp. CC227C TaxID=3044562 RepID=UPI00278C7F66|nr:hypothetical protein [Nocardia sp. CC227C]